MVTPQSGRVFLQLFDYQALQDDRTYTIPAVQQFLETGPGEEHMNKNGRIIEIPENTSCFIPAGILAFPVLIAKKGNFGGYCIQVPILHKDLFEHVPEQAMTVVKSETAEHLRRVRDFGWPQIKVAWDKMLKAK